jgi:hypothetical protein
MMIGFMVAKRRGLDLDQYFLDGWLLCYFVTDKILSRWGAIKKRGGSLQEIEAGVRE